MSDRVPLTLFSSVETVLVHASWTDPLNPTDPWNGYPYQWRVVMQVQPQSHSDPTTPRPFTYNGLDVSIGDWLAFPGGIAVEIISIVNRTDSTITAIVEDVGLHNILNDRTQSGQGIGGSSAQGSFDCLIFNLSESGVPVFTILTDYSVPINLVNDIISRFQFRNYVQDFIPGSQTGNSFEIGDIIYIDSDGSYKKSNTVDPDAINSIGSITSIDQPSIGDFTYRPLGRYVTNLPTLPGLPGQKLYVSPSDPGGLTNVPPPGLVIPVYIKISDNSAILMTGSGGGGSGSTGNLTIFGNTITPLNTNGNINLIPNGDGVVNIPSANLGNIRGGNFTSLTTGRVVVVGPNGELIDTGYFTFDVQGQALRVGNVRVAGDYISSDREGVPLVLSGNDSNVRIAATLDLEGNRIVNVSDPDAPQDVATKSYVDAVASGLNTKDSCFVATAIDLNAMFTPGVGWGSLTSNVYERLLIDGEEPSIGDRILVKDQNDPIQNGIYTVVQIGGPSQAWLMSRSTDFNGQGTAGRIESGDFVFVEDGDVFGATGWVMTSRNPITVNVTPIVWTQFSSAGVIQAGHGLTKTGNLLDVNVSAIIDRSTGLTSTPGPTGKNIIEIHLSSNTPLEFNNGALRITSSLAGNGVTYDLDNGRLNVNNNQPTIVGIGTVVSGTWNADTIGVAYGGTGLDSIGDPGQVLTVNQLASGLEYTYPNRLTESDLAPDVPPPQDGDRWYNTITGIMFTRITDDSGSHWVEL